MPRRYHGESVLRSEHTYLRVTLTICVHSCYLRVTRACRHISCTCTRACLYTVLARDFRLRVNLQKMRVHGCVHAIRVILNAGVVYASIKFKSSCTVTQGVRCPLCPPGFYSPDTCLLHFYLVS